MSGPGIYTCRASTRCGSAEATSIVLGNLIMYSINPQFELRFFYLDTRPMIDSGTGLVTSPTSEVKVGQSVCLSASGPGSSVDLVCHVTMGSQFTTFKWTTTSNPSTVLSTNETLTVTNPNSYRCTAESPCGLSSVVSIVNSKYKSHVITTRINLYYSTVCNITIIFVNIIIIFNLLQCN